MGPIAIGLLAGAGLGFLKGQGDVENAKEARKREAEIARWSPWTGLAPQRVEPGNVMYSAMQGALTGAQFGKQFGGEKAATALADSGSAPGTAPSPTGPYLTEAEYAQNAQQPLGLPPTTAENGWLEMPSQTQNPLGYPTTQYPQALAPMPDMKSPWPYLYGPSRS
jgi:hypothetical protein